MENIESSFLNSKKNITYLKRTGHLGQYRYWYWHQKFGCLVAGKKPKIEIIEQSPQYAHHPHAEDREFQVGDVVFHWERHRFGVLICQKSGFWFVSPRIGTVWRCKEAGLELVCGNIHVWKTEKIEDNLIGAKTQAELEFAERINAEKFSPLFEAGLPNISIGEKTLLKLHRMMFHGIYAWAGRYRKEDLVVGKFDSPTLGWQDIKPEIKIFFKGFGKGLHKQTDSGEKHLIEALLVLHKKLAWMHPFQDGNGRIIRLFSEIVALEWGYALNWNMDGRNRKKYHYAVRKAVHTSKDSYLRAIIKSALRSLE